MRFLYTLVFLLSMVWLNANEYAPKQFYLVDSLNLDLLSEKDKELLVTNLEDFHNAKSDTDRVKALANICNDMRHKDWSKYQWFQLTLINQYLTTHKSKSNVNFLKISLGLALNNIGRFYIEQKGDHEKSLEYFWRAFRVYEETMHIDGAVDAINNIGATYMSHGDYDLSLAYFQRAISVCKRLEKNESLAFIYSYVGRAYAILSDVDRAVEYYKKSLIHYKSIEDKAGMAQVLICWAQVHYARGDHRRALKLHDLSGRISKLIGDEYGFAFYLSDKALLYSKSKRWDESFDCLNRALKIFRKLGNLEGEAKTLNLLGVVSYRKKDTGLAVKYLTESKEIYEAIGVKIGIADVLSALCFIHLEKEDSSSFCDHCERSLELFKEIKGTNSTFRLIAAKSRFLMQEGNYKEALKYGLENLTLAKELSSPPEILKATLILKQVYEKINDKKNVVKMLEIAIQLKDSISKNVLTREVERSENMAQIESKEKELIIANKAKQLKEKQLKLTLVIYALVLVVVIFVSTVLFNYRRKQYERELNTLRELKSNKEQLESKKPIFSIPITIGKRIVSVELSNIVCFEVRERYVFLVNTEGKSYVIDYRLSTLENKLPEEFVRIHRSAIINRNRVQEIRKGTRGRVIFTMNDNLGHKVSSGQVYSSAVKDIVKNFG